MAKIDGLSTENPEVTKLLMAHDVAQTTASTTTTGGLIIDLDKYIESFDKAYKAISATTRKGTAVA